MEHNKKQLQQVSTDSQGTGDTVNKGKRTKKLYGIWAIVALIIVIIAGVLWSRPSKVEIAAAAMREMPVSVTTSANVAALNRVTIKPTVSASVASFAVKEGDDVQAGQVLAQLDLSSVQERINALEQSLDGLRSAQSSGSSGGTVARSAGVGAERATALLNEGIITRKEYDAMMSRSRTAITIGDSGANSDTGDTTDNSTQITAVEAALAQLRQQMTNTTITAPMAGRVGSIYNQDRKVAIQDRPFMVIQQVSPVVASFTIPTEVAKVLKPLMNGGGVTVVLHTDQQEFPGTLTYIDDGAATPTALIKATFQNPAGTITPGDFYDVSLTSAMMQQTLAIPSTAIRKNETGTFVYVVTAEGTIDVRLVTSGIDIDGFTAISSGLHAGDQVVVSKGNYELGQRVAQ